MFHVKINNQLLILGCNKDPNPILNAQLKCSSSQCKAQCLPEFQFPSKVTSMILNCINGQWTVKNSNSNDIPICERNEN